MKRRAPTSIRVRVRASMLAIGVLIVVTSFLGWRTLDRMSTLVGRTLTSLETESALEADLETAILAEFSAAERYLAEGEPAAEAEFHRRSRSATSVFGRLARAFGQTSQEVLVLGRVSQNLARAEIHYARANRLRDLGRLAEMRVETQQARSEADAVHIGIAQLRSARVQRLLDASATLQRAAQRGGFVVLGLLLGALLLAALVSARIAHALRRPLQKLLTHAGALSRGDFDARTDGSRFPTEFRVLARELNAATESLGRLASAEAALHESEKLAAVGSLVSGVAHELNNPLAAVLLASEELLQGTADGRDRDVAVEVIRSHASRAREIVRELLVATRPEVGRSGVFDLGRIARAAVETVRSRLGPASPRIDFSRHQLSFVRGSARLLERALTNIVDNAARATGPGGTVRIRIEADETSTRLTVEDDGPGIPEATLPRIFEAFFTTRAVGEGTGLGLFLARNAIENHGGTVRAANCEGGGARFVVELPRSDGAVEDASSDVATATAAPAPAAESGHEVAAAAPNPDGGHRILIVDDEAALRRLIGRALRRRGWQIVEAENGAVATSRIAEAEASGEAFDVVLTDLKMPGMNGMEMVRWIASHHPAYVERLVLCTGDNVAEEVHRFIEEVKRPVLDKPFELPALFAVLDAIVAAGPTPPPPGQRRGA